MKAKVAGKVRVRAVNESESAGWRQAVGPAKSSQGYCGRGLTMLGGVPSSKEDR